MTRRVFRLSKEEAAVLQTLLYACAGGIPMYDHRGERNPKASSRALADLLSARLNKLFGHKRIRFEGTQFQDVLSQEVIDAHRL